MPHRIGVSQARRGVLRGALATLLVPRGGAAAQRRTATARVGLLASSTEATFAANVKVFRDELQELGWIEGRNLTLEARYAEERYDRLPDLAAELVRLNVDVIFAMASPAIQAAKRATTTIPIVIETLGDAVSTGLVPNLARPGGNVTGVSGFAPELSGKRLELIREIAPGAARIALMANRANPGTAAVLRTAEVSARQMRIQLLVVDVAVPAGLDRAFERIVREHSDALIMAADPMLFSQRLRIIELAARHRLPAVYEYRLFVEIGGLLSYGPGSHERFSRAAVYVDRILRGARAGNLPVEQPSTFELAVNLRAARALGLTIPPSLLLRADHVIE